MKGAVLILIWLLAVPAAAQPRTIAVVANGPMPGFEAAQATGWLAQQMDRAALPGWHFVAGTPGMEAPNRVEWNFELLPYAGGGVRQFIPQANSGVLKARHLVSAEARLFLDGQYQTVTLTQDAVAGGAADPSLEAFVLRATRMLENAWQAIDMPEQERPH